jgi:hypothetical protein
MIDDDNDDDNDNNNNNNIVNYVYDMVSNLCSRKLGFVSPGTISMCSQNCEKRLLAP